MPPRGQSVKKSRRSAKKARRPARSHLLIIECDFRKLTADKLDFAAPFAAVIGRLFPNKRIALVQSSSESELASDLGRVFQQLGRFRSILIVGHSNESGLMLAADCLRSWHVVGKWLCKFEPEFCFLAACEAGRSAAVRELFAPVPTLRQIFASPVAVSLAQSTPLGLLICMLLKQSSIDEEGSGVLRIANYILTGGQLFRWKRQESGAGEELNGVLKDFAADFLQQIFSRARRRV